MTTYTLNAPDTLNANLTLPSSKSISNRALIICALAGGNVVPDNLSDCDDTRVLAHALDSKADVIDVGAAGTAMRFLTAYFSIQEGERAITGSERMRHRPIGVLVNALRQLGADITYEGEDGYPPLLIRGHRLPGGRIEVPGNISSQFISALLMIGPAMERGLELHITESIASRSYVDLTLWTMRAYGADADWTGPDTITVRPHPYTPRRYQIENDWTSASYWYELAAMYGTGASHVVLHGLKDGSKQGDSVVKFLFSLMGVKTAFDASPKNEATTVRLTRHAARMQRLDFDFTKCPDLAQTLVVTCCGLGIPFRFEGLSSLHIKETDRIEALKRELRKLGFLIHTTDGSDLVWDRGRCAPTSEPIETYNDHRMAMAFAPLCVKYPGLRIRHPEVVTKSYPAFWDDLRTAGVEIRPDFQKPL